MAEGDEPADLDGIKQAFVVKLLEKKAELDGTGFGDADWADFLQAYGPDWNGHADAWQEFRDWFLYFAEDRNLTDEATAFLVAAEQEDDPAARVAFFARHGVTIEVAPKTTGKKAAATTTAVKKDDDGEEKPEGAEDEDDPKPQLTPEPDDEEEDEDDDEAAEDEDVDPPAAAPIPADVPKQDSRGRTIDEVKPGAGAGQPYHVRIGKVWGQLDPTPPHKFTAQRPHHEAYADWSKRVVSENGYTEDGREVDGTWFRPWPDQQAYLFRHAAGGGEEWAQGTQVTGTVVGSRQQSVGALIGSTAEAMDGPNQL